MIAIPMLVVLSLAVLNLTAQKKTLMTAEDGFKWYKLEQNDKEGAQSLRDVTLIPLSRSYNSICYNPTDGGWFGIVKNGKKGACNRNGREIVAPNYKNLLYSSAEKVFKYEDISGKWVSTGVSLEEKPEAKQTSGKTKENGEDQEGQGDDDSKLLYAGFYKILGTKAKELEHGYNVGSSFDETEKVRIYEDRMTIYFGTLCKYKSTNEEGERIYEGTGSASVGGGKVTAYVSPNFSIRLVTETTVNGKELKIGIPVAKGRSLMQQGYNGRTTPNRPSGSSSSRNNDSSRGAYTKKENCPSCHGSKNCETCLGKGWRTNPYNGKSQECPVCHGKKICQTCNGTGKQTKTKSY